MRSSSTTSLLAAAALFSTLAPSLGGEWCENFEAGPGTFWTQPEWQGGRWQHTSYTNETKTGHRMPRPPSGEDGVLVLRGDGQTLAFWSMLVSPVLEFTQGAAVQLQYWLALGSDASSPVTFMMFRRVNGVDDSEAFLDITNYVFRRADSGWMSLEVGLNLDRGSKMQIVIYGYLAGDAPDAEGVLALDRVTLRGVTAEKACGERSAPPPGSEPPPPPTASPRGEPDPPPYDFFCPERTGLFLDPSDCALFYSCSNWDAYHMACPAQLVFSQVSKECWYRNQVPGC